MTKDRSFKLVEPFKVGYRGGSLPMLIAENSLGFTAQIEIQECDLDVDQARALRDWLTSVLPDEPPGDLCGERSPQKCALPRGHEGSHRTRDGLLEWSVNRNGDVR